MVTATRTKLKPKKVTHFGQDRDNVRDQFELCIAQCFLGPMELDLKKSSFCPLTFCYTRGDRDNNDYGAMEFDCQAPTKPLTFRVLLHYIEHIQIVPPTATQSNSYALVFRLCKKARVFFRKRLAASKDFVLRKFPLTHVNPADAFCFLVFTFKPWNEVNPNHVVRTSQKRSKAFHDFGELRIRIDNWLKVIRDEDIKQSGESDIVTKLPFTEEISTLEWLDLTTKLNLRGAANQNHPNLTEYRYFRPGQVQAVSQPRGKSVEVQSLFRSPENGQNWLEVAPQKFMDDVAEETSKKTSPEPAKLNGEVKRSAAGVDAAPKRRKRVVNITLDESHDEDQQGPSKPKIVAQTTGASSLLQYGQGRLNISLCFADVDRLAPGSLLNDNVIEFYLRFLQLEHSYPNQKDHVHIFNTFLFSRLVDQLANGVARKVKTSAHLKIWLKRSYESVRKWTRGVDIFQKKILVFPINYEEHWYVIIVTNPGAAAIAQNSNKLTPSKTTNIFVLNSLNMSVNCRITKIAPEVIREYLEMEYTDKHGGKSLSTKHIVTVPVKDLSGQLNLVDCGVYLLAYTELFLMWTPRLKTLASFNFNSWWPLFRTGTMNLMRYKILSVLRNKSKKEVWKQLNAFEKRTMKKSTEQLLEEQLQRRGLRRWNSQMDIRPRNYHRFRKRCKSLDRVDPDLDHLDPIYEAPLFD